MVAIFNMICKFLFSLHKRISLKIYSQSLSLWPLNSTSQCIVAIPCKRDVYINQQLFKKKVIKNANYCTMAINSGFLETERKGCRWRFRKRNSISSSRPRVRVKEYFHFSYSDFSSQCKGNKKNTSGFLFYFVMERWWRFFCFCREWWGIWCAF